MSASISERSMSERLLDALEARTEPVNADLLAAAAGVRRLLLPAAMNQLIREGKAYMVGTDMYAKGRNPLIAKALPVTEVRPAQSTHSNEAAKNCRRCDAAKPIAQFNKSPGYPDGRDIVCKACRKLATDVRKASSGPTVAQLQKRLGEEMETPIETAREIASVRRANAAGTGALEMPCLPPLTAPASPAEKTVDSPRPAKEFPVLLIAPRPGLTAQYDASSGIASFKQGSHEVAVHVDEAPTVIAWLSEVFGIDATGDAR